MVVHSNGKTINKGTRERKRDRRRESNSSIFDWPGEKIKSNDNKSSQIPIIYHRR